MSVKAISSVWQHSKQRGGALLVELAIADFCDDQGRAWPAIETLAKKARMTPRNVNYIIEEKLKPAGLTVEKHRGPHRANLYRLSINLEGEADCRVKTFQGEAHFTERVKPISPNPSLNRHKKRESTESDKLIPLSTNHSLKANPVSEKSLCTPRPAPTPADPRIKEITATWAALYLARVGADYLFTGKDFRLFKSALQTFDLPRLKELVDQFFDSADSWVKEKAGFTVGVFHSKLNSLASTSTANRRPELKVMTT